jgi:hypothetical protein
MGQDIVSKGVEYKQELAAHNKQAVSVIKQIANEPLRLQKVQL